MNIKVTFALLFLLPPLPSFAIPQDAGAAQPPSSPDSTQNDLKAPATEKRAIKIIVTPPQVIIKSTPPDAAPRMASAARVISDQLTDADKDSANAAADDVQSMGTITVEGHKLEPICVLSFLKVALNTEYSKDPMKSGETVCRFVHLLYSRARTYLRCESNADLTRRYWAQTSSHAAAQERTIALQQKLPVVDPGKLLAAIEMLPPDTSRQCNL